MRLGLAQRGDRTGIDLLEEGPHFPPVNGRVLARPDLDSSATIPPQKVLDVIDARIAATSKS